jgi:hypothetical protein
MAIKVYTVCALMSSSTVAALVTEYVYFGVLVNEDLCRVYLGSFSNFKRCYSRRN